MRYRIPVVVLAAVAVFGYGCVQGKVLTDPANARTGSTDSSKTISLLTITPTSVKGTVGQSTQLTAAAENQSGTPISGVTFTWASSNTQVASVDSSGNVTLVGVGSANISASAGGLTTSVPATATAATVRIASVSVTPSSATLNPGSTQQFQAVALDSIGNVVTGTTFTWSSSNTSDATVSATGLVSAVVVGTAVITASAGGKSATANVSIVAASPASVASISISPASASVMTGMTTQLTATLKDSVGNILGGRTIAWSTSNTAVAAVSSTGLVTGVAAGTATISAASGGKQGTAQVTITAPTVDSLVVAPGWANLSARQTLQLQATPYDGNGKAIGGQTISWSSSDSAQASVSSTGVVSAVGTTGTGSVTIYASTSGHKGHSTIHLIAAPVATVTLSPTTVTLNSGQTSQLTATAKDQYGDVITTDAASWSSSNTSVATVSSSGLVTAVGSGSATVTVTVGGMQATATVTVASAAVASVTVSPTSLSLTAGQSQGLTATAKDGSGNVLTGYPATWTSSNTGMATVSSSGVVTGVAAGTSTITVTIGGKSAAASATVTSSTPTVATVTVTPGSSTIAVGNQVQLTATDKTSSGTVVSGQSVTWTTSNSAVATVASNGIVTAVSAGGATITATSDSKQGTASITVSASSGGGPYHEPTGMVTQVNTGPMTNAPSTAQNGTWTEGPATFTNWAPNPMDNTGDWSGNIAAVPGGTGLRVYYEPSLQGGSSPVRWGTSIPNHGTGYLYVRWKFRLSPNWTNSQANQLKMMEPRSVNTTENQVVSFSPYGNATDGSNMWFNMFLQFTPLGIPTYSFYIPGNGSGQDDATSYFTSSSANVGGAARGSWHVMELYIQPESPAGAGNGQLTLWVDGNQVFQSGAAGSPLSGLHYFLSGESMGWQYIMFDPSYGGDQATDHPPYEIYWDIDELYVSTK